MLIVRYSDSYHLLVVGRRVKETCFPLPRPLILSDCHSLKEIIRDPVLIAT